MNIIIYYSGYHWMNTIIEHSEYSPSMLPYDTWLTMIDGRAGCADGGIQLHKDHSLL